MIRTNAAASALLMLVLSMSAASADALKLVDYPVPAQKIRMQVSPKLEGTDLWQFRTQIKRGVTHKTPNFAGHYVLVAWGCGSGCRMGAIVDVLKGTAYRIPEGYLSYEHSGGSRLLKAKKDPISSRATTLVDYYVWNGDTFVPVHVSALK